LFNFGLQIEEIKARCLAENGAAAAAVTTNFQKWPERNYVAHTSDSTHWFKLALGKHPALIL